MTRAVVVFGATGYVGEQLVEELARRGHAVVVVARGESASALARPGVRVATDAELAELGLRDTVVVNLAYPRAAPGLEIRAANVRLLGRVVRAVEATRAVRLIQASTQAVFGYHWKKAPVAGPAPLVLGDSYIESKRHAEYALRRHWHRTGRRHDLAIVRLGNILGAGAMPWVTGTAQRILEGRAAAGRDGNGRLNGTHVRNIADYLATLVEHDGRIADGATGVFHHLAEFADRPWRDLVEPISRTIGVRALYRPDAPASAPVGARTVVGSLVRRFASPLARTGVVTLLHRYRPVPKLSANADPIEDDGWFMITGGDIALPPSLLPGWTAPHTFESMLREIDAWLPTCGYTLRADVA